MQAIFNFSSFLIFVACLLCGAIYAYILYRKGDNIPVRLRYLLAVARMLAVALVLWLIFSPLIASVTYTLEKPLVLIAQDNSASVSFEPAGFNRKKYQNDLQKLAEKLSEKYEVHTFNFSDGVYKGYSFTNTGQLTDGELLINYLTDEYQNRNVGAIVLASDGIFNRGGNPLYALQKIKAPVYTIALGDTIPKRDVLISNISYNELSYLGNDFPVEVQVQAFQGSGSESILSIVENGQTLLRERISVNSPVFVKDIPLKLHANSTGVKKYTVSLTPIANEITVKNNSQDFFIEVIDGKQDVLIAANGPHPDIAALRQAIEQNKNYKVTLAFSDDLDALDLRKFGTIILYQLPSTQQADVSFFQKINRSNASIWYIVGAQSNLNRFNQIQSQVQFGGGAGTIQEVFPLYNPNFTNFYLPDVATSEFSTFDPLQMPFGQFTVIGNSSVVLKQRIGKVNTENALWFFIQSEHRKAAYLLGEGFWRWRLHAKNAEGQGTLVDDLISKSIQYLSVKDDKRKFRVFPAKPTFDSKEAVVLNANLYNDAYAPVNSPEVSVKVFNANGKSFNYVFSKTESAYRLEMGVMKKGNYTFEAATKYGDQIYTAKGVFYVDETMTEYQQLTANHAALRAMSAQSGGQIYRPSDLTDIYSIIQKNDQLKTISYEDRKYVPLIERSWIFVVILLMLAGEWFVRKRFGEV